MPTTSVHRAGLLAAALTALGIATGAQARDQIRIVGSSTVYPFSSYVAEELGATTGHPTPVVESTGSGGGMKLFCTGTGMNTPDITNASRRMKVSEYERCRENGVSDITEAMIGYDGIVVAHHADNPELALTRKQILLAVAAEVPVGGKLVENPYKKWSDIDPSLPDEEILIYGPPTTSGTRDAFEELVMEATSKKTDAYGGKYSKIRQDGAFVPSGENDNLIVQKLAQNRHALGIFGYSFLEENEDKIQGAVVDGVAPGPDTISSGEYPVSRSLFFYIKKAHEGRVAGMDDYVSLFMSEKMIGPMGYLKEIGLIPLPDETRTEVRERVASRVNLTLDDLE